MAPVPRRREGGISEQSKGWPGGEPESMMTPAFLWYVFGLWWKVVLPVGMLLAAGAATLVYWTSEPEYMATAWLEIRDRGPFIAFPPGDRTSQKYVRTQIELLRSPVVLQPVIRELDQIPLLRSQRRPLNWLQERLEVRSAGDSELYSVSFHASDPETCERVVNAVIGKYFELQRRKEEENTNRVIELLEDEKKLREEQVKRLQANVSDLAKQAMGKDPFLTKRGIGISVGHPLAGLQDQLVLAEVEREVLGARVRAAEEKMQEMPAELPQPLIDQEIERRAEVVNLKGTMAALKAELEKLKSLVRGGENSRVYKDAASRNEEQVRDYEDRLKQLRSSLREQVRSEKQKEFLARRGEDLARLKSSFEEAGLTEKMLRKRYENERKRMEEGGDDDLKRQFKEAELQQAQLVLDRITLRLTELRTEQRAPARADWLSRATEPEEPMEAVPWKRMGAAMALALLFPFGLAVLWERVARRMGDAEQVERASQLAVIGEIPRLPVRAPLQRRSSSSRIGRQVRLFEESVNGLAMNLFLREDMREARIVAVTSAVKHEGKTSVAAQLAVSLARTIGQPVLLVDGDMRIPGVHRLFDVPLEPGLAGVLGEECALENAVVTGWSNYVHLLPAGKLRVSPCKLLASGKVETLLQQLAKRYRHIIIDTPPVLSAAEAMVLVKSADAALVCVMRNVSRAVQIRKVCERVVASGGRPVGAVLSGVPIREYSYRYGAYYGR